MKDRQQIGDVARDITERLEPRVIKLTVHHVSQEPQVIKVPIRVIEQDPLVLEIRVERRTAS
jgi:hypothetical protein